MLERRQPYLHTEAHPLFFDSLFTSYQTTTPDTVISDYREQKRADSRAEHGSDDLDESSATNTKNNVEFYAEVFGKLVGTIRDGFTSLVDDVRLRNSKRKTSCNDSMKIGNEKLKHHKVIDENVKLNMTATEPTKMQMIIESTSQSVHKGLISIHDYDTAKQYQEIKLTIAQRNEKNKSELIETDKGENGEIQSTSEASSFVSNGVVQVIDRRKKHKRSDMSQQKNQNETVNDEMDVEQLDLSIESGFPFDVEMTNEHVSRDNSVGGESDQRELEEGDTMLIDIDDGDESDERWFSKHRKSLARLSENHRKKKQKLIKLFHQFLTSSNDSLWRNVDEFEVPKLDEPKFTFTIKRGNSTILNLTPKQFIRMFYRGSDEHAELQKRTKTLLQKAFYKYARLYLVARKGYKDARSFNRMVREEHPQIFDDVTASELKAEEFSHTSESLNLVNEDDNDDHSFATNNARSNIQVVEGFAILILEIFGAMLGLTLGAIGQIQSSLFFDI